jgi:hypothetical protein
MIGPERGKRGAIEIGALLHRQEKRPRGLGRGVSLQDGPGGIGGCWGYGFRPYYVCN